MKLLVIGDIFGRPGRETVASLLPGLKEEYQIDFVIANGENMAHGSGMTIRTYEELQGVGVDFFTTGNHIFKKKEIFEVMNREDSNVIRPANYPPGNPGKGHQLIEVNGKSLLIMNLIGRVFMGKNFDCPFRKADEILSDYEAKKPDAILLDFHAEVTSEKIALRHYLDGRISAMWGTHTHIPTADSEITDKGMAYITDVGMVGPKDSVIGTEKMAVIDSFLRQTSFKLDPAEGRCIFNAIVIELGGPFESKSIELIQKEI